MSLAYSYSRTFLIGCLACNALGCTLSPKVNVSEGVAKSAASEIGSGMEGAAKEFGQELVHASRPYEEEILTRVRELNQSVNHLIETAREMPRSFGEAVTDRLVKEESFQRALRGFAVLAQSPEHLASAVEKGPYILSAKLDELQTEFAKDNGFMTQQRTALFDALKKEREAVTEAIRQERASAIKDMDVLIKNTIDEVFSQITSLVERSLGLVIALILVLWGLPFVTGFFAGRMLGKKKT